jgi:hypothetical protein
MTNRKDKLKGQLKNAVIVVIASWIIIPLIVIGLFGKPDSAGTLGDTFGIVNALFSALAFALLIYTSLMQREELELQRNELELTRRELEKSAEAQTTLVNLTKEQLELEKSVRKAQVKPEFIIESSRWSNDFANVSTFQITLTVKYYTLKLVKIELAGNRDMLTIDDAFMEDRKGKFIDPGESILVALKASNNDPVPTEGLKLKINFKDIDGRPYWQTVFFEKDKEYISNAKGIEASLLR